MKVALCLHGYFNSFSDLTSKGEDGFEHLDKHVLSKVDTDIFIHSWDVPNKSKIEELYKDYIVSSVFEDQIDFTDVVKRNNLNSLPKNPQYVPPETIFSHMYSLQKSFEFERLERGNYDIVIKSRFDIGRINRRTTKPGSGQEPVQCINFDPSLLMNKFYMASWKYLDSEGPADMWFYSSKENMMNFRNIYTIIKDDMVAGSEFNAWAGSYGNGMLNTIKAYKWFLIKTGLWQKKALLKTTWE